jgi:hypothetical protein
MLSSVLKSLYRPKPLFSEPATLWMFDACAWVLENLDVEVFVEHTRLLAPNNADFPGEEADVQAMAELIFSHVSRYANMKHWPFQVLNAHHAPSYLPRVAVEGPLQVGSSTLSQQGQQDQQSIVFKTTQNPPQTLGLVLDASPQADNDSLPMPYDPNHLKNPQAMISSFALTAAHYLVSGAVSGANSSDSRDIPGGHEMWPQLLEVLTVFMGFGVLAANSAYTYRRSGCGGSCQKLAIDRPAFLSPYEVTFLMAVFAELKGLENKDVTAFLHKPLKAFYKKAVRELSYQTEEMDRLKQLLTARGA